MPLGLHPECRTRLHDALVDALPTIEVKNGMFLERHSIEKLLLAEFILPRTGQQHERLVEYLDEFPLTEFVLETIGQELWELDRYQSDVNQKLTELDGYREADVLATRLLNQFESLPWDYRVSIPLPEALSSLLRPGETNLAISPTFKIVRPTAEFASEFPLRGPNKQRNRRLQGIGASLLGGDPKDEASWDEETTYLQFAAEGFLSHYGGSIASSKVERQMRSFFGMALALRLLDQEASFYPVPPKSFAYVHRRRDDGTWEATTRYELDNTVSHVIAGLKFHELEGRLTAEVKLGWTKHQLGNISAAFCSGKRGEPVILATQWLFDSFRVHDELLSFVQSMVVLEILLGDKSISDEIGIGALISNRYAYLVGTTHDERAEMIETFKTIYKVRSQIIHSGKPKLNLRERSLLNSLRKMCRRAVTKEIDLLKAIAK